jgi:hypothetical protein
MQISQQTPTCTTCGTPASFVSDTWAGGNCDHYEAACDCPTRHAKPAAITFAPAAPVAAYDGPF